MRMFVSFKGDKSIRTTLFRPKQSRRSENNEICQHVKTDRIITEILNIDITGWNIQRKKYE